MGKKELELPSTDSLSFPSCFFPADRRLVAASTTSTSFSSGRKYIAPSSAPAARLFNKSFAPRRTALRRAVAAHASPSIAAQIMTVETPKEIFRKDYK